MGDEAVPVTADLSERHLQASIESPETVKMRVLK